MPTTPISLAMEMGQWLKQLTEDYFDCEIQEMQDFLDSIRERMEHRTKSFVDINFMLPTPAVSPTSNII